MKVGHLELPVADPLASLRFYTQVLGFAVEANQGDTYIWLSLGDTVLMLRPGAPPRGTTDEHPCLVLYSEDLEQDRQRLEKAGLAMQKRGSCLYFTDPDGHWFQLVDPGDDHSG